MTHIPMIGGLEFTRIRMTLCAVLVFFLAGCESIPQSSSTSPFTVYKPQSILVLPPIDGTFEVAASYAYLPTISRPIAERGYYVFPVAVVDRLMRENGLSEPAQMHQVPLSKIRKVFGADAVLYLTLSDWGSSYRILYSRTKVSVSGRLIDVRSGQQIWQGEASASEGSDTEVQRGNLGEMLIGALMRQVATSIADDSQDVARQANQSLFETDEAGFLPGPYLPANAR